MWPSFSVYALVSPNLRKIQRGSSIFCVDLTWNDPFITDLYALAEHCVYADLYDEIEIA